MKRLADFGFVHLSWILVLLVYQSRVVDGDVAADHSPWPKLVSLVSDQFSGPNTLRYSSADKMPDVNKNLRDDEEYVIPIELTSRFLNSTLASLNGSTDAASVNERRHFAFEAFGRYFHLILQPQKHQPFASLAFVEHYAGKDGAWSEQVALSKRQCFYSGKEQQEVDSKVVLNICDGLFGYIGTLDATYFIYPSKSPSAASLHLLRKTQANSKRVHYCDAQDLDQEKSELQSRISLEDFQALNSRSKRSFSRDLHIEVMITADHTMKKYYGSGLRDYILTLMSIVAEIFRDPSLENSITIAVVKIVETEETEDKDFVSTSAPLTLKRFCKWQSLMNYKDDSYLLHYDVAILLTRVDICRAPKRCDTLGLADLGTMCDSSSSCAIVEDNGLSAAFTVAHELGHVLNLPHDDDPRCHNFTGHLATTLNVMARFLDLNTDPWSWSSCSAYHLTEFLDAHSARCLRDKPTTDHLTWNVFNGALPGQSYGADQQCEMLYGSGSKICPYMPTCNRLWCLMSDNKGCRTHHMPWADGTPCSTAEHLCYRGLCRHKDDVNLKFIDGEWGKWSDFSECSRSCGGGIQRSIRRCNNPRPQHGGKYCIGERIRYQSCQTDDCPTGTIGFRERQCSDHDKIHFRLFGLDPNVRWVPKYSGTQVGHRCKLICRVSTSSDFYVLRDKVIDGTPCGLDTFDICVNGRCMPAGCDHELFSKSKLDKCGVCGGQNQSCRKVSGQFNQTKYGYNRVVLIPAGSAYVDVEQYGFQNNKEDDNYLALKSDEDEYILNGGFTVTTSKRRIEYGGGVLEYTGSNTIVERINSSRPLLKDLIVEVLAVGKLHPPNIQYHYHLQSERSAQPKYIWILENDWSNCSRICEGQQSRRAMCSYQLTGRRVNAERCRRTPKPSNLARSCNDHCILSWTVVNQSECQSDTMCGEGFMERDVICEKQGALESGITNQKVDLGNCEHILERKPPEVVPCSRECYWEYTSWSQCSQSCKGGTQSRKALCKRSDGRVLTDEYCSKDNLETTYKPCDNKECPIWEVGNWTKCSKACNGKRLRPYWCQIQNYTVSRNFCDLDQLPVYEVSCSEADCYSWDYGLWSSCSASCGRGEIRRLVRCRTADGNLINDSFCNATTRPLNVMPCEVDIHCPKKNSNAADADVTEAVTETVVVPISKPSTDLEISKDIATNKPATTTSKPQPKWDHGQWTECSSTCGVGYQTRSISCMDDSSGKTLDESFCALSNHPKPSLVMLCIVQPCVAWRSGDWTECSKSCGGGQKERVVVCEDEHFHISSSCEEKLRPESTVTCNEFLCPSHWVTGEWTDCSTDCGTGKQTRQIECVGSDGILRPEAECPVQRPIQVRSCVATECPSGDQLLPSSRAKTHSRYSYSWRTGPWNLCSVTCGSGVQKRQVICLGLHNEIMFPEQCLTPSPNTTQECRQPSCAEWIFTDNWSTCSKSCGGGTQWRLALCFRDRHQVDIKMCPPSSSEQKSAHDSPTPPVEQRVCALERCPQSVHWKKMAWSSCSKSCIQHRQVVCTDDQQKTIAESFCPMSLKPKTARHCRNCHFDYTWVNGPWSECSKTCGTGYNTRTVTCHHVNRYGWIYPETHSKEADCNITDKPVQVQNCHLGDCKSLYKWTTMHWRSCSKSCGTGVQKRRIYCVDRSGHKVGRKLCRSFSKPNRRQSCNVQPCEAASCLEVQKRLLVSADAHYDIWIRGTKIQMYCADMSTSNPKEFLTLSGGNKPIKRRAARKRRRHGKHKRRISDSTTKENFSEFYEKRLIRADTCPANGKRLEGCECIDTGPMAGLTVFHKIRINITSLKVMTGDFRFTKQMHGQPIEFGKAGDCYSLKYCPQGKFSINLTGTGLVVDKSTSWTSHGHHPHQQINASMNGQRITGQCGGYCGACVPDPRYGLLLDVNQPT